MGKIGVRSYIITFPLIHAPDQLDLGDIINGISGSCANIRVSQDCFELKRSDELFMKNIQGPVEFPDPGDDLVQIH